MPEYSDKPLILVVEDDVMLRMLLVEALEVSGFDYVEANNGLEALEHLQSLVPDAILMDVLMPELDGFETCRRIRQHSNWEDLPIIMMTALEDVNAVHIAYEAGATDFLTKPIQFALLEYRLRYMMRSALTTRALRASEYRLENAQRIARLGQWEWNPTTSSISWSRNAELLLGITESTSLDEFFSSIPAEERSEVQTWFDQAISGGTDTSINHHIGQSEQQKYVRQQSEPVWDENGRLVCVYGSLLDISDIRKANEKIHQLAYFDGLTGLPNREQFRDRVELSLHQAKRYDRRMATLFLDLDHFKRINDTLGHALGDVLLRQMADRLSHCLRTGDSVIRAASDDQLAQVARLGGDEFTILLSEIDSTDDPAAVARRILETLKEPFDLEGHEVYVTPSIGISVYPEDGTDIDTLLKHADVAMYSAKKDGRNGYRFYQADMNEIVERRLRIENELRRAISKSQLQIHLQPQLDLVTARVCGAEALLRWNCPALGGEIEPSVFIPIAEESGLIFDIGDWVMREACRTLAALREQGHELERISVNVSAAQFTQPDFIERVTRALADSNLDPGLLEIEITESLLLSNFEFVIAIVETLKSLGVKLAIDDFGTGYSSLTYLKRLKLDRLKLDRSFLQGIESSTEDAAIARAVIALGEGLQLRVIAEGVEESSQLKLLKAWGCDEIQGFLFSHPLPLDELKIFLQNHNPSVTNTLHR